LRAFRHHLAVEKLAFNNQSRLMGGSVSDDFKTAAQDSLSNLDSRIRVSQVEHVYSQSHTGLAGALLGAAVLTLALWNKVSTFQLVLWFLCYVALHIPRFVLLIEYEKASPAEKLSRRWATWFAVGAVAGGMMWGLVPILFFPAGSQLDRLLVSVFVVGIACGAAAVYWPLTSAYLPTIAAELLPLSGRFIYEGDKEHVIMGAVVLMFAVILVRIAQFIQQVNSESRRLLFEKENLVDELREAQTGLETRVRERTAELLHLNEQLNGEIAQRRLAEESISREKENLERVFEAMEDGVHIVDEAYDIQYVNRSLAKDMGPVQGRKCYEYFHNRVDPCAKCHMQAVFAGKPVRIEWHSDKSGKTYELMDTVLHNSDGTLYKVEIFRDITGRKEAETALRESKERFRDLVENLNDTIFSTDGQGAFTYVSPRVRDLLGYEPSNLVGQHFASVVHPEDLALLTESFQDILNGELYSSEYRLKTKSEDYVWVRSSSRPIVKQGQILGIQGVVTDISERKKAEEVLRRSEQRFRTLIEDVSSVPVQGYDENRKVVFWNSASERLYGYFRDEAIGKQLEDLIVPPHMRLDVISAIREWTTKGERIPAGELELMHKDGSLVPVYSSHVMLETSSGKKEMYCVDLDLAQLKKAENERATLQDQLRHAQKMQALGTLAGGIAHDFNNILTPIIGFAELALDEAGEDPNVRENLEEILVAAQRARDLIRQILALSRFTEARKGLVCLSAVVEEVLSLLKATIPSTIQIHLRIETEQDTIEADSSEIHQMIMNLCTNAAQAMSKSGGTLMIGIEQVDLDAEVGSGDQPAVPRSNIRLTVRDTGCGMSSEVMSRIFEPYFTTKHPGEGTGLGLAMVQGIVHRLGGRIDVESRPGEGTLFSVYLPSDGNREIKSKVMVEASQAGTEHILVIDDEQAIVRMFQNILQRQGYRVTTATDGPAALTLFEEDPQEFDLVITDMTMPAMTGKQLSQLMLKTRPNLPIILMTGYSSQITVDEAKQLGLSDFLLKPLSRESLLKAIRRSLDASKEG